VLYECLTGARAFPGATVSDTIAAVLGREPDWSALPARTPPNVRRLLQRCLRKDARLRLRDVSDARLELEDDASEAPAPRVASRKPRLVWWAAAAAAFAVVASGALVLGARGRPAEAPRQPRLLRLTWDGAIATDPALSPDGSMVVYASNRGGGSNLDLWLQRVSGGTPTRLTNDPADDRQPSFSPDGSTLAFRSARGGGGLYVMSALGGDARLLASGGHHPRFSPDGASLAFSMGPWLGGHDQPGTSVFIVPTTSGEPRRVAAELAAARNPVWAPDGKSLLLFGRGSGPNGPEPPDWWWAPLDGRPPVATGAFRAFAAAGVNTREFITIRADLLPTAWTPEGVFTNGEIDQSEKVWRLAVSPQTGALAGEPVQITAGPGHHTTPALDRASRVAFRASLHTAVMSALPLDANAGRAKGAIVRLASDAGDGPHRGSVDPLRRVLAFPKQRPTESELWLKDLEGGQERHLVTTPPGQLNPIVAPDARHVAYTSDDRGSRTGWAVTTDGGVPRRLCDGCVVQSWLDSSRVIVSTPYPNAVQLRTLPIQGGQAEALLQPDVVSGRADPSPDGRWLAMTARGRAVRRTWIAPLRPGRPPAESEWNAIDVSGPGGPAERAIGGERTVGWSPDGRLLYMLLEPDGFRCLYAVPIDPTRGAQAGPPFLVRHFHDPQQPLSSTPFGNGIVKDAFVFDQVEIAASIWLLDPRSP
jgi:Tol biopolymer transport system component